MRNALFWLRMLGCLAAFFFFVGVGSAQEITVRPQPPAPPSRGELRLEPLEPGDRVRIPEQNFRPEPLLTDHAPAFIHPLAGKARVGAGQVIRFGASAWTAPHEVGGGISSLERNGGVLAVGFTLAWGVPDEETPLSPR